MVDEKLVDLVTKSVISILQEQGADTGIRVGVSARHVHLSQEDLETLFGKGYELTPKKMLMGDQYAAEECVTLVSPSLRSIEGVRVLGPVRSHSQVEISRTDTFKLKVSPPVRPSGEIKGSAPMALVGPKGTVFLNEGCIIANRHIHMTPADAEQYGIKDNDLVDVEIQNAKPTRYYNVQVRVRADFNTEMHIDTDDANAAGIKTGDHVEILTK
ncbi:MAG TPA: phosphate propanoyltransferase [Candidatus Avimonoglobus intestinipullorum]|uniref:Phosphate propanoyltransferase n=1 Tax=Candidatus Avimonoglobus intestinipullorum TaxID=2840699 RepID=A0A9D1S768_9FIRM|nr:phosphate propanoyltransferase [Candidatus Avimonoglobus intestinipullorum]